MAWILEQALQGKPGWNYWWVAPVYPVTEIAFRRLKRGLPPDLIRVNESRLTIELIPMGTIIWFKSGEKPDNLYGEDVHAAVVDEATRLREEAWFALRSTITATRGPVRFIGNVKGRKNWAYRLARRAEAGEPDMHFAKITAADAVAAGVLAAEEIESARRDLPENVFQQLYMAEPGDDEGNPFGIAAIQACLGPLSTKPAEAWGWDLAKSVDWTAGIALDADGAMCRQERFQKSWLDTIDRIVDCCGEVGAEVDSTGVGDVVLEQLQRQAKGAMVGYTFTSKSKQQLMEGLAVAVQKKQLTILDGVVRMEMESFEYTYTASGVRYSAPEGEHDDTVCALALAWHRLIHRLPELRFLGDDPTRPKSQDEQLAADEAAFAMAKAEVDNAIRDSGFFWPEGRR